MPLTFEDIPDNVYERLKLSVPGERLARARELRSRLQGRDFRAQEIDLLKRQGRP